MRSRGADAGRGERRALAVRDAAFVALYREHAGTINRYVRRRLGDELADDVTAEVFARALERPSEELRRQDSPLPWLYGIASNVIHDHHRAEQRRLRTIGRLQRAHQRSSSDGPELRSLDPRLADAVRRLSRSDRDTVLLVAWGELSYEEAATALGIPVGTVRSRLSRVRRLLDAALGGAAPTTTARSTGGIHV